MHRNLPGGLLDKLDFLVVQDMYATTGTAARIAAIALDNRMAGHELQEPEDLREVSGAIGDEAGAVTGTAFASPLNAIKLPDAAEA